MKYDVFISYRREGGYDTAKHLYDLLTRDGYTVSFDIDTLRSGDFDTQLLERIDQCKDFILIVDAHAFDRTLDLRFDPKKDWLRQELAYALKKKKNIIPIFLSGVSGFPQGLPGDLVGVTMKNGPEYNRYYFNDFYDRLKKRFLHARKSSKKIIFGIIIVVILVVCGVFSIITINNVDETFKDYSKDSVELANQIKSVLSENTELIIEKNLKNFCDTFSYVTAGAMEEGINYVYCLELDPLESKVKYKEESIGIDIRNSKGWCGTLMQWPEIWEVWQFDMKNDGKSANVEFRKKLLDGEDYRETIICEVILELDENNNLRMSYVSGEDAPSVLLDEKGGFSNTAVFRRD